MKTLNPPRWMVGSASGVIDKILGIVCEHYDITEDTLTGPGRGTQRESWARSVAMFLIWKNTNMSFPEIGRRFNRTGQGSARHDCIKVQDAIDCYAKVKTEIDALQEKVSA